MADKMTLTEAEIKQALQAHFRRFVSDTHFRQDADGRICLDVEFKRDDNQVKELRAAN